MWKKCEQISHLLFLFTLKKKFFSRFHRREQVKGLSAGLHTERSPYTYRRKDTGERVIYRRITVKKHNPLYTQHHHPVLHTHTHTPEKKLFSIFCTKNSSFPMRRNDSKIFVVGCTFIIVILLHAQERSPSRVFPFIRRVNLFLLLLLDGVIDQRLFCYSFLFRPSRNATERGLFC